jgi:hypothetical protein
MSEKTRKIVINVCFGGFGLSAKAQEKYLELSDVQWGIDEYDGQEWVCEAHRTWN